jgi:hypothetical protein
MLFCLGTAPMFFTLLYVRDLVGIHHEADLQRQFGIISLIFVSSAMVMSIWSGSSGGITGDSTASGQEAISPFLVDDEPQVASSSTAAASSQEEERGTSSSSQAETQPPVEHPTNADPSDGNEVAGVTPARNPVAEQKLWFAILAASIAFGVNCLVSPPLVGLPNIWVVHSF